MKMRLVTTLFIALAVAGVSGVIVEFHLWGSGKTAGTGTAYYSAPTTAIDIANRAAGQQRLVTSVHIAAVVTYSLGGTTLKINQDLQYDHDIVYEAVHALAATEEVLQLPDGSCVRDGTGPWKTQPVTVQTLTASDSGRMLRKMVAPPYTNLQRDKDTKSADGRSFYVLSSESDGSDLNNQLPEVTLPAGQKPAIDSVSIRVTIDKATLLLATEKMDISFHIGPSLGHETLEGTFDRFDEPARFPPDLPKTCSHTTT